MEDWQKHVLKDGKQYYCGATPEWHEWSFQDKQHALNSVDQDSLLQPCTSCIEIINQLKQ